MQVMDADADDRLKKEMHMAKKVTAVFMWLVNNMTHSGSLKRY